MSSLSDWMTTAEAFRSVYTKLVLSHSQTAFLDTKICYKVGQDLGLHPRLFGGRQEEKGVLSRPHTNTEHVHVRLTQNWILIAKWHTLLEQMAQ